VAEHREGVRAAVTAEDFFRRAEDLVTAVEQLEIEVRQNNAELRRIADILEQIERRRP
jgi:hypothetical protein